VSYNKKESKWRVQRRSKSENNVLSNGCYDNEETAARASDTLARKLIKSGEQNHKLNFPDDHNEVRAEKNQKKKKKKTERMNHRTRSEQLSSNYQNSVMQNFLKSPSLIIFSS